MCHRIRAQLSESKQTTAQTFSLFIDFTHLPFSLLSSIFSSRRLPAATPFMAVSAILVLLLFAATCLVLSPNVSADMFRVGDEKGWNPNVNYTIWERKHRPFHVGDWLVFYYQAGQADVLQVDEVAYEKCDASHPISNYSKGRNYAFQLNHTKTYYFICSYGYCYQGMKVAVTAENLPPPSPPPSKHKSGAAVAAPFVSRLGAAILLSLSLLAPALFLR